MARYIIDEITGLKHQRKQLDEDTVFRQMFSDMRTTTRDVTLKTKLNEEFETVETQEPQKKEVKIAQNDPYFVELKNNMTKFVGAIKTDDNSLIVYPEDNDVVFSAAITGLNDLKFQFRYNDQSGGLYIWADSVLLTKDAADKLGKLVVLKEQFSSEWDTKLAEYQNNVG